MGFGRSWRLLSRHIPTNERAGPGVGSPASALRDASALYSPSEKRYHPRGLRAGPGTEVAGGAGWWPTE